MRLEMYLSHMQMIHISPFPETLCVRDHFRLWSSDSGSLTLVSAEGESGLDVSPLGYGNFSDFPWFESDLDNFQESLSGILYVIKLRVVWCFLMERQEEDCRALAIGSPFIWLLHLFDMPSSTFLAFLLSDTTNASEPVLESTISPWSPHGSFYWRMRNEEIEAANVTLDEATAHPALLVSERGRRVTWQETCQDLPRSTQRFNSIPCVLGQLRINSGRAYWEVEVGDMQSWDLGICRDNVTREGVFTMSPQNGFWAIRLYDGDYWALTSPETSLPLRERPLKVGIFLDYEAGDVSFYNMTDGSHIFTFPQNTFYGVLRPLFRLWSSDSGSLTICSAEGECTDIIHKSTLQAK
ncbi:butyrophilin subfamily 1 member A1-like [Sus scrofa]|uniref:butyrophilin subfamily 1 member A1-like n=1 Tax=Sus scrofa TaxID=9823 RepID=UPI000A2AF302|nr:butyrophilin subfamily 1 member A1-like [Sus scrofa]